MDLLTVAFYVVYIFLDDVNSPPQTSFPVSDFQAPKPRDLFFVFSFYKCNITKMCNINFDADREITPGTEREGQRRRILFRGKGGVILSFLSCIVILIL